jgi:hypothetical protein
MDYCLSDNEILDYCYLGKPNFRKESLFSLRSYGTTILQIESIFESHFKYCNKCEGTKKSIEEAFEILENALDDLVD